MSNDPRSDRSDHNGSVVLVIEDEVEYARRIIAPHFATHWRVRFAHNVPDGRRALDEIDTLCAAIVDLNLPGGLPFDPDAPTNSAFELVDRARHKFPQARVVVLTGYLNPTLVNTAHRLGAEYLVKGDCDSVLPFLACKLMLQEHPARSEADVFIGRLREQCDLTPRQTEVVALALRGLQNNDIAEQLGITANTLKRHVAGVLDKCNASSLAMITRRFLRGG